MTEIVMFDSQEAAQPHTMTGWKSRNGHFYAEENDARYDGCTHRPCNECGKPAAKAYLVCNECRNARDIARYESMPQVEWDGSAMLYSDALDRYFSDLDDASDECGDGKALADLRLIICEPNYARQIDEDYFCDELPEDGEAPPHIQEAIEKFNEAVASTILSWSPGKHRLKLEGQPS